MKWVTTESYLTGRVVAIDFETTGLDPKNDRITQIGYATWVPNARIISRHEWNVNPDGVKLSEGAAQANGLNDWQLAQVPVYFADIEPILREVTEDALVVAHNLPFEVRFWAAECERACVEPPPRSAICTHLLSTVATKTGLVKKQGESTKLSVMAQYFGIDFPEELRHTAVMDAVVCAELYAHLVDRFGGVDLARYQHDKLRQLPPERFAKHVKIGAYRKKDEPMSDSDMDRLYCYMDSGWGSLADAGENDVKAEEEDF